jgi:hypothetical protein
MLSNSFEKSGKFPRGGKLGVFTVLYALSRIKKYHTGTTVLTGSE